MRLFWIFCLGFCECKWCGVVLLCRRFGGCCCLGSLGLWVWMWVIICVCVLIIFRWRKILIFVSRGFGWFGILFMYWCLWICNIYMIWFCDCCVLFLMWFWVFGWIEILLMMYKIWLIFDSGVRIVWLLFGIIMEVYLLGMWLIRIIVLLVCGCFVLLMDWCLFGCWVLIFK